MGYAPVAPGTVGSLWGVLLVWGLHQAGLPIWGHLVVAAVLFCAGTPLCTQAARSFPEADPSSIVLDEIAAVPVVFLPLLLFAVPFDLTTAVAGFLWFRLFDIVKPWPVKRLEALPDGLGIMADDLGAAVYAAAALFVTFTLLGLGD